MVEKKWLPVVNFEGRLEDVSLAEWIGQAIGAASMCWEDVAKAGVFDSTQALIISDSLHRHVQKVIDAIIEEISTASIRRPSPVPPMNCSQHIPPMTDHVPHRGSNVEAWLKSYRDQFTEDVGDGMRRPVSPRWEVIDDLLDIYREHADAGTPLSPNQEEK